MKETINGNKYIFFIDCFKFQNKFNFLIEARHKRSHTHSCINNVNCILSELNADIYDCRLWESEWIITKKEAIKFFKKAYDLLTDYAFRSYIEKQLDLDRKLGEWSKS